MYEYLPSEKVLPFDQSKQIIEQVKFFILFLERHLEIKQRHGKRQVKGLESLWSFEKSKYHQQKKLISEKD